MPVHGRSSFESLYAGQPRWEIGRPQRMFLNVADQITGSILDSGCGTGEIALFFASRGQKVTGIDFLFGTFLTWLNDHESDVYVICTANDVSKLPPEFSRAERFDGVFFIDLPGPDERRAIWRMYLAQFELDENQRLPDDESWTGAEIRACCRLAALLDLPLVQAAQNVVPVAVTAAESVERLRSWASGRCLSADRPGIFRREEPAAGPRRTVSRKASNSLTTGDGSRSWCSTPRPSRSRSSRGRRSWRSRCGNISPLSPASWPRISATESTTCEASWPASSRSAAKG